MRLSTAFCSSLLILAASCGGSDVSANASLDSGYSSLNSKDYSGALGHFDGALAGLKEEDENYLGAKLGQLQAMAHVDAEKTKTTLMALSKESGISAKDYRMIVEELGAAAGELASADKKEAADKAMAIATEILSAGKETFPEYASWDALLKKTGDLASKLGSSGALDALTGLGYAGDD